MARRTGGLLEFVGRLVLTSDDPRPRPLQRVLLAIAVILLAFGSATFLKKPVETFDGSGLIARLPASVGWIVISTILLIALKQAPCLFSRLRVEDGVTPKGQAAVFAAGTLGTFLACAPVIFLGQSLLSPDNDNGGGPVGFYETCPVIPGYKDCRREDTHGADTSAMTVSFFPSSVVQERAIKQFGEFPLWNRYNSAGVSMIGQGQSMLGDPLNWVQWLVGVDAWSFDAKFVILRVVFASAIGLAVLVVTGGLRAAMLTAFAAPFVGFFLYRVDHPAIFTLCYAPLISLAWLYLICSRNFRTRYWWLAGLVGANWLVINSGTVKEAYVAILLLNVVGVIQFIWEHWRRGDRNSRSLFVMLIITGLCFVAMTLPIFGTFLIELSHSRTNYDAPGVIQKPLWQALVLVDSYFNPLIDGHYFVASNPFLASGFIAALLGLRWLRDGMVPRTILTLCAGSALAFSIAFHIIPGRVLIAMPFLRNIIHVDTTFATVLLVPASIVAGIGIYVVDKADSCWQRRWLIGGTSAALTMLSVGFMLGGMGIGLVVASFALYAGVVLPAAVLAPWLLLGLAKRRLNMLGTAFCGAMLLAVLARGASYPDVHPRAEFFEPGPRTSLIEPPGVVKPLVRTLTAEPGRVVGLGTVLFPGYNGTIGLETVSGPDALMVRPYHELMEALDMPYRDWAMRFDSQSVYRYARALDLLGVRYIFSSSRLERLRLVDSDERIQVYARQTAWPRAFFSSQVEEFSDLSTLADRIRMGMPGPFVGIETSDAKAMAMASRFVPVGGPRGQILKASDYSLTVNSTAFTVKAPTAGVIYLGEADVPGDFEVTVNGEPVPYFKANYAFKALTVPGPGTYRIVVTYWPEYLTLFLLIAAGGALVWIATMVLFWRRLRNRPVERGAPPAPADRPDMVAGRLPS